jgi:hypothetical protein
MPRQPILSAVWPSPGNRQGPPLCHAERPRGQRTPTSCAHSPGSAVQRTIAASPRPTPCGPPGARSAAVPEDRHRTRLIRDGTPVDRSQVAHRLCRRFRFPTELVIGGKQFRDPHGARHSSGLAKRMQLTDVTFPSIHCGHSAARATPRTCDAALAGCLPLYPLACSFPKYSRQRHPSPTRRRRVP